MVSHAVFMAQMPIYNVGENLCIPMRVCPALQVGLLRYQVGMAHRSDSWGLLQNSTTRAAYPNPELAWTKSSLTTRSAPKLLLEGL